MASLPTDGRSVDIRIESADIESIIRDLKKAGDEAKGALKQLNYEVAVMVRDAAKARAGSAGRQQATAARSLRAGKSATGAFLNYGGKKYPFAMGAEFGSNKNKLRETSSGRAMKGWNEFRPFRKGGYFLYSAIKEQHDAINDLYLDRLMDLVLEHLGE